MTAKNVDTYTYTLPSRADACLKDVKIICINDDFNFDLIASWQCALEIASKRESSKQNKKIDAFWCIEKMMLIYGIFVLLSQQFIWIPEVNRTKKIHPLHFRYSNKLPICSYDRVAKERFHFQMNFLFCKNNEFCPLFACHMKQTRGKKIECGGAQRIANKSQFNYLTYNQRWALSLVSKCE